MSNLISLQEKFQSYLLSNDSAITIEIDETKKVSATTRLQIYSNAYQSRLIEALASNYPMLQKFLGDESFQELALLYIDTYPSTFRSIRWFGDQLQDFLQKHHQYAASPYLAELAKIEWTMTLAFDAADQEILNVENIIQIPADCWPMMRFKLHPSVYICDFEWNTIQIWQNLSQDIFIQTPIKQDASTAYVFWRKDLISQYCSLPQDERYAIDCMIKGHNFGEICEGLCQWIDEEAAAALRAASLLKGWVNSGLISSIEI